MRLRIHNITEYYKIDNSKNPGKDTLVYDIYNNSTPGLFSADKSCNNMMLVNETLLIAICKSSQKIN